jgi:hypothetical protein
MSDAAAALRRATPRTLLIMDELGRGLHSSIFWLNLSAFCGTGVHSGVV